jgi:hypothetical protein
MDRAMLTMATAAMADPTAVAADVARRLGITTTTLYTYVNGMAVPMDAIVSLRRRLAALPTRHPQRKVLENMRGCGV